MTVRIGPVYFNILCEYVFIELSACPLVDSVMNFLSGKSLPMINLLMESVYYQIRRLEIAHFNFFINCSPLFPIVVKNFLRVSQGCLCDLLFILSIPRDKSYTDLF